MRPPWSSSRTRRASPPPFATPNSDSDSDDLFGGARRAAEEAAILARRARLVAAAPPRPAPQPAAQPGPARAPAGEAAKNRAPGDPASNDASRPRKRARKNAAPVFDMFAAGAAPPALTAGAAADGADAAVEEGGYARLRPGDVLDSGRYVVEALVGQGVFASVYRCRAAASGVVVAVKVSRANAAMRRAALREAQVLREVHLADPLGRAHVVGLVGDFVHRGQHVALVFEYVDASLRGVVRAHPGGVRLAALRLYGAQLLRALALLARLRLVHADVKPDNVLVSADRGALRVADFGCAVRCDDAPMPTGYLAARFYRAPEAALGAPPAPPVDVWAAGCVLFELYTGAVAFPARDNTDLLARCMAARGPLPNRVLRQAPFRAKHFDAKNRLLRTDRDPVSGEMSVTPLPRPAGPPKVCPLRERILEAAEQDDERASAPLLADLLDGMLALDPAKRITPADALRMPLFQTRVKARAERKGQAAQAAVAEIGK